MLHCAPMPHTPHDTVPVTILVDADACPVKEEIYRVAERFKAHVRVVSNSAFRVPVSERVQRVVVSDGFDAADDWIAERAGPRSVVVRPAPYAIATSGSGASPLIFSDNQSESNASDSSASTTAP